MKMQKNERKNNYCNNNFLKNMKKIKVFYPVCIVLIMIGLAYIAFIYYLQFNSEPASSEQDYKTYTIETSNLSKISSYLKDEGLIKNKFVFQTKSLLSGVSGKFGKGSYELSPSMSCDELIEVLQTEGIQQDNTIMVTIKEGSTIEEIAQMLYDNKVIYDKNVFLDLCKKGEKFKNNPALSDVDFDTNDDDVKFLLEGYLFPDTYEFYLNSSSEFVINKMLDRFNEVYDEVYQAKMKEYGYNKNDVVILASIIEKEGKTKDFSKISSILHNRLDKNMPLQVDASVRYLNNLSNTISISEKQYNTINSYNTYKNKGLMPTAICNPSKNAINAVLYPDEDFIKENYLYFCLSDYETGTMVFSKTYEEHLENVKKYKDNWQAYDAAIE